MSLSNIKISDLKDDGEDKKTEDKTPEKKEPPKGEKDKDEGKDKDKSKDFGISPDSLHCELKIGVTGSFESRSGHVASGLASAIYVSLDGNFKEVKHDQSLFATNFLDEDTTFMIGPVPIPIGISGSFNLNAEIDFTTDINYAIAFVGMYGAGTEDNEEKWFQINDYPGLYGRAGLSANILHEMDEKVEDVAITMAETIITPPIISIPTIIYNLLYRGNNQPIYYYYGDWQKLKITPENVTIGGVNFGTKRITKKAKAEYRESNDYGESSTIAAILENIQRAYSSNNEADYYYALLCNNIENQIQEYVYDIIFRPSPRIDQNNVEDQQYRYNR